jgi:hypothetical protein
VILEADPYDYDEEYPNNIKHLQKKLNLKPISLAMKEMFIDILLEEKYLE